MSGWDPAHDTAAALDSFTAPSRAVAPPPPRRTVSEPRDVPEPDADDGGDHDAATTAGEVGETGSEPADAPPEVETDTAAAREQAPAGARQDSRPARRGRPARGDGPRRTTTAQVPAGLAEALTRRKLSEAAEGRKFVINDFICDQITSLPTGGTGVARELERWGDHINLGVVARDPGWKPTQVIAVRLTAAADRALDRAVFDLYTKDANRVDRQDLIAVAIVRGLDALK
jgi:hypothetical protein